MQKNALRTSGKLIRAMKMTIILLTAAFLHVSATGVSQKISFSGQNVSLESVFSSIEKQTDFVFMYSQAVLKLSKPVSVSLQNMDLKHFLSEVLKHQPLVYKISGKNIFISPKPGVLQPAAPATSAADTMIQVTGKVTDQSGVPLPGVTIQVKGKSQATMTDSLGSYAIRVPGRNAVLQFSFVGYKKRDQRVNGQMHIDIVLSPAESDMSEVVIIAYGAQKKVNITGAVSVISSKTVQNRPVTNVINAMQGAAAGLTITRTNGQPGKEGYGMQVRGLSSVNGSNPLFIIDGVPGSISNLNPNDIESVSILKDAASASIYGARAAGGVILVTTKTGKKGKMSVKYSGFYGKQKPFNIPERLHSWEEAEMANLASINAGQNAPWTDEQIAWMKDPDFNYRVSPVNPQAYDYYYDLNQIPLIIRDDAPSMQHNVTVTGGDDRSHYLLSFGYYNQQGIFSKITSDETSRLNGRFNYSNRLSKKLSLDLKLSFSQTRNISPNSAINGDQNILYDIYKLRTIYPIFLPNSNDQKYAAISGNNAYALLKEGGKVTGRTYDIDPILSIKAVDLLPGLSLTATYAPDFLFSQQENVSRKIPVWNINTINNYMNNPNAYAEAYAMERHSTLNVLADYDLAFRQKHRLHVLGGYSFEDYHYRRTAANSKNLISNDLFTLNLGDPTQATNSQDIQTWALLSWFGRLNYNFDDRYLLELNMRYDGSSKLAPENRYHVFPSVSAGWRVNNEKWFQRATGLFDEFKIRASWGQLGNSDGVIGNYDYIGLMSKGSVYPFNNTLNNSFFYDRLASPDKTWETVEISNIGLDLAVLKNRLKFSGDYYVKRNRDMLAPLKVASFIGVNTSSYNVADLRTRGWEFTLGWSDAPTSKFNYWVTVNLSDNTNKILHYEGQNSLVRGVNTIIEGMPYNSIFAYVADGYFQSQQEVDEHAFQDSRTGPGDIRYKDINGDKRISVGLGRVDDHGDLVFCGTTSPRYMYGADLGFNWKGIQLSAFFQGVGKRTIQLSGNAVLPFLQAWRMPWPINKDYWTPDNPDAKFPRLYLNGDHNGLTSTFWLMNAGYLRLKNLQLGYTLPAGLSRRVGASNVYLYFSGQDLWEITKLWIKYFDPENTQAADFIYPYFRTYSFGLNVTF
jgi:TonB-linked outer membrane protein, SusC/RagA family